MLLLEDLLVCQENSQTFTAKAHSHMVCYGVAKALAVSLAEYFKKKRNSFADWARAPLTSPIAESCVLGVLSVLVTLHTVTLQKKFSSAREGFQKNAEYYHNCRWP